MVSEANVSKLLNVFDRLINIAGASENTRIIPNLEVIDAAPTDPALANYIIVRNEQNFYVPVLKLPGFTYTNGDFVNVLHMRGTEPVAMQQGSGSPSPNPGGGLWSLVGGTGPDIYYDNGNVSIGFDQSGDTLLHILSQSGVTNDGLTIEKYGAGSPLMQFRAAAGTFASPQALGLSASIAQWDFYGYEGTTPAFALGARMSVTLDDAISGTEAPMRFRFFTHRTGVGLTEALRIAAAGNVESDLGYVFIGDEDSGVFYQGVDNWTLEAGGVTFVELTEDTQDTLEFGTAANDIDMSFYYNGGTALTIEGSSGNATFGVNANAPAFGTPMTNSSGAAVIAGDIGYMDEAGDFQTTTTANFFTESMLAVVIGGANGATIYVTKTGEMTLNFVSATPSVGDYLVTSTTAGKVTALLDISGNTYMSPEVVAVAVAAGSGSTVQARLLLNTTALDVDQTVTLFQTLAGTAPPSDFSGTIATLPTASSLTYTPTGGNENALDTAASTDSAKMILHNTTRGTSATMSGVVVGTNTINFVTAYPASSQVGDTITLRSQTNTTNLSTAYWVDLDLQATVSPLARSLVMEMFFLDTGAAGSRAGCHPYEANSGGKRQLFQNSSTAVGHRITGMAVKIIDGKICILWQSNGSTSNFVLSLRGVKLAAP